MMKIFKMLAAVGLGFVSVSNVGAETIISKDFESGTLNSIFSDVNRYGGIIAELSSDVSRSGSKSVKIGYPRDEAGVELKIPSFPSTRTLYTRKYEYYAPGWEGNWPVGLKTSRYFTTPNYSLNGSKSGAYAYMSEKLIWNTYGSSCNEDYAYGLNNAIYNKDLTAKYGAGQNFGNGKPYIRTGHWYKYETWMELNSAVDAADGVLKIWIDSKLVYSNDEVVWRSNSRGVPNGTGWQSMWFGGNYSGAICNDPSRTLYRYIDDIFVSTTMPGQGGGSGGGGDVKPNPPKLTLEQ